MQSIEQLRLFVCYCFTQALFRVYSTPYKKLNIMKPRYLLAAAALFASMSAHAVPDEDVVQEMARRTRLSSSEIRRNYDACDSGVTLAMKICGGYRLTEQELRLKNVYKKVQAKAKEAGHEASLAKAEKAWLAYRNAACAFEGKMGAGGGTAEGLYALSCREDLTKQRAERLEASIGE